MPTGHVRNLSSFISFALSVRTWRVFPVEYGLVTGREGPVSSSDVRGLDGHITDTHLNGLLVSQDRSQLACFTRARP